MSGVAIPGEVFDRLYSVPLEEFISTRDGLVKELKDEGKADASVEVKKLRKPTLTLWALNRLPRVERDLIDRLIEASASVRDTLDDGDPAGIRNANAQRRKAIAELLAAAERELTGAGHAATRDTIEKVSRALLAATTDEELATQLAEGRFTSEPEAGDSGWGAAGAGGGEINESKRATQHRADLTSAAEEAQRKATESAAEAQALEREADRAEKAGERARSRADDARRAAERAQKAAEDAVAKLGDR
jgi:hypothetical protein